MKFRNLLCQAMRFWGYTKFYVLSHPLFGIFSFWFFEKISYKSLNLDIFLLNLDIFFLLSLLDIFFQYYYIWVIHLMLTMINYSSLDKYFPMLGSLLYLICCVNTTYLPHQKSNVQFILQTIFSAYWSNHNKLSITETTLTSS